ncbi:Nitrite reductase [NAD(P)H] [compost metagenome]
MEWTSAYLQYYREQANWNERTAHWLERVGLDSIKTALESPEERQALTSRIMETLSLTTDPWREIVEKDELRKNFMPLQKIEEVTK